jgi:dipeptidase
MCDTIVALPPATASGSVLFGKNSDRERNEAQAVEFLPRARHAPDERLRCTYISIPQVRETCAVLLCRPFWLWGAEMGANEHGVVIGNEAVHARIPPQQEPALIGMDLLRLALERATSAPQAVETIIALLEQHGQGGSCGHLSPRYYNNSFLVADAREAFVLETVGRMWVVQRARGIRTISNAYSIGRDYDRISPALLDYARVEGWCEGLRFDFAEAIVNLQQDAVSNGRARCARSAARLQRDAGRLDVPHMMAALRDHGAGADADPDWHPQDAPLRTICMHAADADRGGQTVNAMVSELRHGHAVHWVTATAAPCLSVFKPVLPGVALPPHGPRPTDRCDPAALWWRHEQMHRAMLADFATHLAAIRAERDALEQDFQARIAAVLESGTPSERARVVAECWADAEAAEQRWMAEPHAAAETALSPSYRSAWAEMNRLARVSS